MGHGQGSQVVGSGVHKDSILIAVCELGGEPARFAGTIRHDAGYRSEPAKRPNR
jgi:hypothetical protein